MTTPEDRQFRSAIDAWLLIILIAVPLVSIAVLVSAMLSGGDGAWAAVLGLLVVVAIYGGLLFPLYYRLDPDCLLVRYGFVQQRVRYETIRSVRPTHSPLSSPALSLNRLRVEYGSGAFSFVLISPVRREEFLTALASRAGLIREGDALRRRDA